jgi:hypothetical protein
MVSNASTSEKVLHSTEEEVLIFNPLLKKDRLKRSKRPLKLYHFVIYNLIVETVKKVIHYSLKLFLIFISSTISMNYPKNIE